MWPDPQFPEEILQEFRDGETLNETEEILDGKLFLCSYHNYYLTLESGLTKCRT